MRLRRVALKAGGTSAAVWDQSRERWLPLRPALEQTGAGNDILRSASDDLLSFLAAGAPAREAAISLAEALAELDFTDTLELTPLLPFQPRLLRAFACWERHWEQAARGLVRRSCHTHSP